MSNFVNSVMGAPTLPPAALGVSLVIALVVSQAAALYPAWRAAHVRIIEAIQHE